MSLTAPPAYFWESCLHSLQGNMDVVLPEHIIPEKLCSIAISRLLFMAWGNLSASFSSQKQKGDRRIGQGLCTSPCTTLRPAPELGLVWPSAEGALLNVFLFLLSTHRSWLFGLSALVASYNELYTARRCLEQRGIPGFSILMGAERSLRHSHCFRIGCGRSTWASAICGDKYHGIIEWIGLEGA